MLNMSSKDFSLIFNNIEYENYIAVYGEWCGNNIQKGVALVELPKMFVIFDIKVDDNWIDINSLNIKWNLFNKDNIYNIEQFPTYNINIDFNNPQLIQNKLIELTIKLKMNVL